jgi:cytochrome P450
MPCIRWLGRGLVSEPDPAAHAAARELLAPAFHTMAVRGLMPLFARIGQELAALLMASAGRPVGARMGSVRAA